MAQLRITLVLERDEESGPPVTKEELLDAVGDAIVGLMVEAGEEDTVYNIAEYDS
jgi:hypothetical protein